MASRDKNFRQGDPHQGGGFKLAGFPKEFERNFWDLFDKRYYLILLTSFVVSYVFVALMTSRDWSYSEEQIRKLKQNVIQKVYGAEILPTPETDVEEDLLSGPVGTVEEEAEEISEEGKQLVEESATDRVERRKQARVSRAERVRQMEQEVASAGILAVATAAGSGGTGGVEYSDVLGDLAGGAGGINDVGELVSGTLGITAAESEGERTRVARGGAGYRGAGDGVGIDDLIEGEGVSRTANFKRRGEIELSGSLELTGSATGAGGRDQNSLLTVINKNQSTIEYCYQKRLKVNPSLKGEVYLEVEIMPDGTVAMVRILNSNLADSELEDCIKKSIRRWRGFGQIDPTLGSIKTRFKYIF